jgi:hypothetical protein
MDEQPTPDYDAKDDVIASLHEQIATLQGQVTAMEHFANIVVGQRNEAQNEVAKLQTQAAMKGY